MCVGGGGGGGLSPFQYRKRKKFQSTPNHSSMTASPGIWSLLSSQGIETDCKHENLLLDVVFMARFCYMSFHLYYYCIIYVQVNYFAAFLLLFSNMNWKIGTVKWSGSSEGETSFPIRFGCVIKGSSGDRFAIIQTRFSWSVITHYGNVFHSFYMFTMGCIRVPGQTAPNDIVICHPWNNRMH